MEEEQIMEKIDKFFNKENLEVEAKYAISKKLTENYWEAWQETEEEPEEPEEPDEFGEDTEDIEETEDLEDLDTPQKKPKKKKSIIKKPKLKTK